MTPPAAAASSVQRGAKIAPPRSRPRRVSGPVQPVGRPRPAARPAAAAPQDGLVIGLLEAVETISTHRLLDRLIRGRIWIGLLAFALIGIVTLQLGLLKLNSGIGRAIERSAKLQSENAALSIENSELASGSRVEAQAERLGMRLVAIDGLHFLASHARGDVAHAAATLREPVRPPSESGAPTGGEASESTTGNTGTSETSHTEAQPSPESEASAGTTSGETAAAAPSEAAAPTSATEGEAPAGESSAGTGAGGGTASPAG